MRLDFKGSSTASDIAGNVGVVAFDAGMSLSVDVQEVPGAPTDISAATNGALALVTFVAPVQLGGSSITGYTVTSNPDGIVAGGPGVLSSPIAVPGLRLGVPYTFTVTATNATGTSETSQASNVVSLGSDQVITFNNPGAQAFDASLVLELSVSSGLALQVFSQTPEVCTVNEATGTMSFISAGTCTVVARQEGDATHLPVEKSQSFVVNAVAPGVPTIQAVDMTAAGQASVSFTAPGFTGGADIDGYRVTATPQNATVSSMSAARQRTDVITATGTRSPITLQGLVDGVRYIFAVAAYNAAGEGLADFVQQQLQAPQLDWVGDLQKVDGDAAFELSLPRSDSPGAFTFASSNPEVATVQGRTVTLIGPGSTTLTAVQAAAEGYLSALISVGLTVNARPDPTRDSQVSGGLQAQVDASVRFAQVQGENIRSRLRQVRGGSNASSSNLSMAYAGNQPGSGLSLPLGQDTAAALPALPQGWGLWLAGTATFGHAGRNGRGRGSFDFNTGGLTVGADRAYGQNALLGMAASWGRQGSDFEDTTSKVDADQYSLAGYGLWRLGEHLFVDGLLGTGQLDFDLRRWSAPAAANAHATRQGEQWFAALTLGYEQRSVSGSSLTGYGRYDAHRATLQGYREQGLGVYDLDYASQRVRNNTLAVGLEGSHMLPRTGLSWRPYWNIEYRSALENRGDARMNYVQRPQASDYVLAMRSYSDDTLSLGAGLDLQLDIGWMFSLLLGHEQGRNALRSNSIGVQVRYGQQGGGLPMQADAEPYQGIAAPLMQGR